MSSKRKYLLWFSDWSLLITGGGEGVRGFWFIIAIKWPNSLLRLCSIVMIPPHWQVISSQFLSPPSLHTLLATTDPSVPLLNHVIPLNPSTSPPHSPPSQALNNDWFSCFTRNSIFFLNFIWNLLSKWTIKFNSVKWDVCGLINVCFRHKYPGYSLCGVMYLYFNSVRRLFVISFGFAFNKLPTNFCFCENGRSE